MEFSLVDTVDTPENSVTIKQWNKFIDSNKEKGIYLHQGFGNLEKIDISYQNIHFDNFSLESIAQCTPLGNNIFKDQKDIHKTMNWNHSKPFACTWFSNGKWSSDPFNYLPDENEKLINSNFELLVTTCPNNILEIRTREQFIQFSEKYSIVISPDKKNYERINWDFVRNDGFYGVYFSFSKSYHVGCTWEEYEKYNWHPSFDVESLVVWDTRAYNEIYAINIVLSD